ncbi:hypothetical protein EDD15DRAFT_2115336, partial [Pisolithus albus]
DCEDFQHEWNLHPISAPTTNNKSPQDLRLISSVVLGEYRDECEGIHPLTIERYYAVHGRERACRNGQTGAGHLPDEEPDADDEETVVDRHDGILRRLETNLLEQVRHEAVEVLGKGSPCSSVEDEAEFWSLLDHVILEDITSTGCGLLLHE